MTTTDTSSDDATATLSRVVLLLSILIVVNMSFLGCKRKFAQRYPRLASLIPDATLTTIVGIGAGAALQYFGKSGTLTTLGNSYESLFMIVMLPPIIFESTISIHKENFYKNIGSILIFAIFGTAIAIAITSIGLYYLDKTYLNTQYFTLWECFTFGALISSTDPVSVLAVFKEMNADKMLYTLIYGESMLNDAISISSYNTFALIAEGNASTSFIGPLLNFLSIFLGSLVVGVMIAILCALIIKNFLSNHKDPAKETYSEHDHEQSTETILMVLIPWIAYLIGEGFGLSGIVSILFCGITINRYAFPNMSHDAQKLTSKIYHVLGSTFENTVFIFIGIGFFSFEHDWENLGWKFFALTVLLITVARFIQIYFLATLLNFFRTKSNITSNFKAIMANSGFRGAMSFALATSAVNTFTSDNSGKAMLSITLVYISLSTFIMGTILVPLCEYFDVREKPQDDSTIDNTTINVQEESRYCWNRIKSGFGAIDTVLCSYLIESKEGELELDSFDYKPTGNDSPTHAKCVAFLSVQPQTHQELVPVGKSLSVTRVV